MNDNTATRSSLHRAKRRRSQSPVVNDRPIISLPFRTRNDATDVDRAKRRRYRSPAAVSGPSITFPLRTRSGVIDEREGSITPPLNFSTPIPNVEPENPPPIRTPTANHVLAGRIADDLTQAQSGIEAYQRQLDILFAQYKLAGCNVRIAEEKWFETLLQGEMRAEGDANLDRLDKEHERCNIELEMTMLRNRIHELKEVAKKDERALVELGFVLSPASLQHDATLHIDAFIREQTNAEYAARRADVVYRQSLRADDENAALAAQLARIDAQSRADDIGKQLIGIRRSLIAQHGQTIERERGAFRMQDGVDMLRKRRIGDVDGY